MSLFEKLNADVKNAMKARDKGRLSVLRMLLSELQYEQSAAKEKLEMSDAVVLKSLSRYAKRLSKSLSDYPDEEQKAAIREELAVVEAYLPQKASPEQTKAAVAKVLAGLDSPNMGAAIKGVMAELGGSADGKLVSQLVKESLSS
jgi:uncharacterized protein YqeY